MKFGQLKPYHIEDMTQTNAVFFCFFFYFFFSFSKMWTVGPFTCMDLPSNDLLWYKTKQLQYIYPQTASIGCTF